MRVQRYHWSGAVVLSSFTSTHRVLVMSEHINYDFDLFVIGGGSGGLAASKAAAALGAKVAVADFVKPSPAGTTWGLGGTCVNVGCIPKKLFHFSALTAEHHHDSVGMGWETNAKHNWQNMVDNVNNYIRSLNWNYKTTLAEKEVQYFNAFATFTGPHTLELEDKKGTKTSVSAKFILIACGGRPNLGGYPGAEECCISSDDIFWRKTPPGKTLVVGASYIALECAGFVTGMGFDTTVMVRSILLRGFDQDIAKTIGEFMERQGTKFAREMVPTRFEKVQENGVTRVNVWARASEPENSPESLFGVFDTVFVAVGRTGCGGWLNLEKAGVKYDKKDGKGRRKQLMILCVGDEQTSVPHIFAIGDVMKGGLELTPVAIKAGKLLAARLFGGATKKMDYTNVPTTVFTPLEYGCVGLSEDSAKSQLGSNMKVYHSYFKPLDWALNKERKENDCYVKVIVDVSRNELVVGLHLLGPNAGETVQSLAVAVKAGCTKEHLDDTVFTTLTEVKSEAVQLQAAGGC